MEKVRDLFNILLLSVSLATVLLTLISFIIFKLRYSLSRKGKDDLHFLKGAFFTRYAPHLAEENEKRRLEIESKQEKSMSPQKKMVIAFGSIAGFIFATLSAENYISSRNQYAKLSQSASRVKELVKQGLLERKVFKPLQSDASFEPVITPYLKSLEDQLLGNAQSAKVVLVVDRVNHEFNAPSYPKAFQAWKNFLKRKEIDFKIAGISQIKGGDLVILPQMRYLSEKQRGKIKGLLGEAKFIFTGNLGQMIGPDKKSSAKLLEEITGAKFVAKKSPKNFLPTQFIGKFGLAPGLLSDWYPLDNSIELKSFDSSAPFSLARTSGHYGERTESYFRDLSLPEKGVTWMELDPKSEGDFYEELYTLAKITQTLNAPVAILAPWKEAKYRAAINLSVDTEDKIENAEKFMELFQSKGLKASFYLVSDLMNKRPNLDFSGELFEFASHTKDHAPIVNRPLKELFHELQDSRFDIEERTAKKVVGIRPPEEKLDKNALAAIRQNGLSYIFGPNKSLRFAPSVIDHGRMVLVPRTLSDDIAYSKDPFARGPKALLEKMRNDLKWAHSSNGAHFMSFHTQTFGEGAYLKTVSQFVQGLELEGLWNAHISEIAKWWSQKGNIVVKNTNGAVELINQGKSAVQEFDLVIENAESFKNCSPRLMAHAKNMSSLVIRIDKLGASQSLLICEK